MTSDARLAARLLLGAGRKELLRLLAMTLGVALATLAIMVGIAAPRVASSVLAVEVARSPYFSVAAGTTGMSMALTTATLDDRPWTRVMVSGQTHGAPVPPGVAAWPAAGQTIVSPALHELAIADSAVAQTLGTLAAQEIAPAGLTGPDELLSYTATSTLAAGAATPGQRSETPVVTGFGNATAVSRHGGGGSVALEIVLLVLTPALVFLITALRLSVAARRARSFALGLVGMTPSRAARLYAAEMALVAGAGYALGAVAYELLEAPLGASGLAGICWWPAQARIGPVLLAVIGIATVGVVRAVARRSMRDAAALSRSARIRAPGRASAWVALGLGLPAAGFLAVVDLRGLLHPSGTWMADREAAYVAAAVVAAVVAVIVGAPRLVAACGGVGAARLPAEAALGLRGAAARAPSSRRLIAFVAIAVMLAALSNAFVSSLQRSALGDPANAQISIDLDEVRSTPDWPARLPGAAFTIDATIRGTKGTYDVVIGDCAGVRREAAIVYSEPGPCTDAVQRGDFGIDGASATWLTVGGSRVALAPGSDTPNVTWDVKFPVADAPWMGDLKTGTITFWVSRTDGSYERTLAGLERAFPQVHPDAGMPDPDSYAVYQQQIGTIRAGSFLGLLLSSFALVLAAIEGRWERRRSLAALAAIGMSSRRLRISSAFEFGCPVAIGSVPAAMVGLLGGWAIASFRGTDAMFTGELWVWTVSAAAISVMVAASVGWIVGGARFRREDLADS